MRDRLKAREDEARELDAQRVALEAMRDEAEADHQEVDLDEWVAAIRAALTGSNKLLVRQALAAFVVKVVVENKKATVYYTSPFNMKPRKGALTPSGYTASPMLTLITPIRNMPRLPTSRTANAERQALTARAAALREEGWSYPAIAAELGVSLGTAWGLLNKKTPSPVRIPREGEGD
jgi:DNA-binding NarL/FixJ family response regulator